MVNFTAPSAGTIQRALPTNPLTAIGKSIVGVFIGIVLILLLAPVVLWFAESQNTAKVFSFSEEVASTSGASGYIRTTDVAKADSPIACYENKIDGNCLYYDYKLEELQYEIKDYCGKLQKDQQVIEEKGQKCHLDSNNEEKCEQCYLVNESNWNVAEHVMKFQPFTIGDFKISYPNKAKVVGAEEYEKQIDATHRESMEYLKDNTQLLVAGSSDGLTISDGGDKKFLLVSSMGYDGTYEALKAQDRFIAWLLRATAFILLVLGYKMIFGPISAMSNFVRKIPLLGKWVDNAADFIIMLVSLLLAIVHFILLWILIMLLKNIVIIAIVVAVGLGLFYLYTRFKKPPEQVLGSIVIIAIIGLALFSGNYQFQKEDMTGHVTFAPLEKETKITGTIKATLAKKCTDSDGGIEYTIQGTMKGGTWYTTNSSYNGTKTDSCQDNDRLEEYYCYDSTHGYYTIISCSNKLGSAYVCSTGTGACVLPDEVTVEAVLDAVYDVSNYMERTRTIPEEVNVSEFTITSAQFLDVAVNALQVLLEDEETTTETTLSISASITEPSDLYPEVDLLSSENEELYGEPLTKEEYTEIIDEVDDLLTTEALETLELDSGAEIRYPEILYFVSSILRFYSFYGYLPESYSLSVISPKNLVPWDVPSGYEEYTSVLGKHGLYDSYRYYTWPSHDYEMYKLGNEIVGSTTDPYAAGELIYGYAKGDCYTDVGYFQNGQHPFGVSSSASEWIRFCKGTSGTPRIAMRVLMRALNLPHTGEVLYLDTYGWINAEIHKPYGSNPLNNPFVYYVDDDSTSPTYGEPEAEEEFYPDHEDEFMISIQDIMTYKEDDMPEIETIALFVNPGDIEEYGDEFIVEKAVAGGFNTIILTVKTALGGIYFTTTADSYEDYFEEDILISLLAEAHTNDLKVYAAVSVLQDNELLGSSRNRQWLLDGSAYVTDFVTPCDPAIKEKMNDLLTDLVAYDIDGVILSTLYFIEDTGGEDACDDYNDGSDDWRINLITNYTRELVNTTEAGCPTCDVRILSWPLEYENDYYNGNWTEGGAQNLEELSSFGQGIILPVEENWWLVEGDYFFPNVVGNIESNTGVTPGLSFYLTDEWEFPPEFYNGVLHYVADQGVDFVSFHKINSLDGELGYAFSKSDYQKVSEIS